MVEEQQEARRQKDQIWMLNEIRQAQIDRGRCEMKAKEQHEVEAKTVAPSHNELLVEMRHWWTDG